MFLISDADVECFFYEKGSELNKRKGAKITIHVLYYKMSKKIRTHAIKASEWKRPRLFSLMNLIQTLKVLNM